MATITIPIARIKAAVENKWATQFANHTLTNLGVYNRRKIANSNTWSQHAWGNAWDIGVRSVTLGNQIVAYLRAEDRAGRLSVGTILWQVPDHYDHIHVEGAPKKTGTPPLPTTDKDDDMELIKGIQRSLNAAGFKGANGKVLTVDGLYGANTEAAFLAMCKAAKADKTGVPFNTPVVLNPAP